MLVDIVTIFPEYFTPLELSLVGRARQTGLLTVRLHDLRRWTHDVHRTVDDTPYGGGPGMVMRPEPWGEVLDELVPPGGAASAGEAAPAAGEPPLLVVPTPAGAPFTQAAAARLAARPRLLFACGRYEGIDQRVLDEAAARMPVEEISIGDYVLTGGELPAMVVVDALTRLLPGVIEPASLEHESHTAGILEGPHYTRPAEHEGRRVPAVLLSGDHHAIEAWRRAEAIKRTAERRPDLLARAELTPAERARLPRPAGRAAVSDDELVAAYRSGVGSYRIAARYGISPATVRSRLRRAGVRLRPARGAQRGPTVVEVKRMRKTGMTVRELARHFGVSHVTIIDRLKRDRAKTK